MIGSSAYFRGFQFFLGIFIASLTFSVIYSEAWAADFPGDCLEKEFFEKNSDWCELAKAESFYRLEDSVLNKAYGKLMSELDDSGRNLWRDAQRKWLLFSKAHCSAVAVKTVASPSVRQWTYVECLGEQTKIRTKQLLEYCESKMCEK